MVTRPPLTRVTFAIRGIQVPSGALRLEQCLASCDGIWRVEVSCDTQRAKIEFDEQTASAQAVTRRIAEHEAGDRSEPLVVSLLLKVQTVESESTTRLPRHVLRKLHEIESLTPHVSLEAVEMRLKLYGDLTTRDLIRALASEGTVANVM